MSLFTAEDTSWMKKALKLAEKGRGHVSPNPLVGCIIVDDSGKAIGRGYHERFGQAHAEINALDKVKNRDRLKGATVYVTLEPCAHTGKTPPCAAELARLPIARVVIAQKDPNPKVDGKGMQILRDAGILVDAGLLRPEAMKLNEHFNHFIRTGRPFVTLKIAQTLDGYIAAHDGSSQWITGEEARRRVHQWRSEYDAVLIGRNTAVNDNPRLTVRHVEGRQPRRIVIDGPHTLPRSLHLFTDQYEAKTYVITHNKEAYRKSADPMLNILDPKGFQGVTLLVEKKNGHSDLNQAFSELGRMGIASVLVEPGSDLGRAIIRERLADKLELFIAPKLLGGGTRSVNGLGIETIQQALELHDTTVSQVGPDTLISAYF